MLKRANHFNIFCFLDNNGYQSETPDFECMLALGATRQLTMHSGAAFDALKTFFDLRPSWLFGHLGFALKSETTGVNNNKPSADYFSDGFFFEPEIIIQLSRKKVSIYADNDEARNIFESVVSQEIDDPADLGTAIMLHPAMLKADYFNTIDLLKQHLHRGDCYEINFCHYFIGKNAVINPIHTFSKTHRNFAGTFCSII